jgi:hypothetical protein
MIKRSREHLISCSQVPMNFFFYCKHKQRIATASSYFFGGKKKMSTDLLGSTFRRTFFWFDPEEKNWYTQNGSV